MKNQAKIIFIIIVIILLGGSIVTLVQDKTKPKILSTQKTENPQNEFKEKTLAAKTDSQGEVSVEVTPQSVLTGDSTSFNISFNTHSVELDQDLSQLSQLKDDQGQIYQPLSWSGGSGGHHLSGVLTFPKIPETTKSIELTLFQIGGFDRTFSWEL